MPCSNPQGLSSLLNCIPTKPCRRGMLRTYNFARKQRWQRWVRDPGKCLHPCLKLVFWKEKAKVWWRVIIQCQNCRYLKDFDRGTSCVSCNDTHDGKVQVVTKLCTCMNPREVHRTNACSPLPIGNKYIKSGNNGHIRLPNSGRYPRFSSYATLGGLVRVSVVYVETKVRQL